ncbi:MAG: hypothetical protein ACI9S8_000011 [Chlamydiales bacterium]|jgi:hypothetical protein
MQQRPTYFEISSKIGILTKRFFARYRVTIKTDLDKFTELSANSGEKRSIQKLIFEFV